MAATINRTTPCDGRKSASWPLSCSPALWASLIAGWKLCGTHTTARASRNSRAWAAASCGRHRPGRRPSASVEKPGTGGGGDARLARESANLEHGGEQLLARSAAPVVLHHTQPVHEGHRVARGGAWWHAAGAPSRRAHWQVPHCAARERQRRGGRERPAAGTHPAPQYAGTARPPRCQTVRVGKAGGPRQRGRSARRPQSRGHVHGPHTSAFGFVPSSSQYTTRRSSVAVENRSASPVPATATV